MTDRTPAPKPDDSAPRKRGRPKGLPKTGGRQKGTKNHVTPDLRQELMQRANPVRFLADVMQGRRVRVGPQAGPGPVEWQYPSLDQRVKAANTLLSKLLPDLKATELSGPNGGPVQTDNVTRADPVPAAMRIASLLGIPLRVGGRDVAVPADALTELPEPPPAAADATVPISGMIDADSEVARRMAFILARGGQELSDRLGLAPAPPPASPPATSPPLSAVAAATQAEAPAPEQRSDDEPGAAAAPPPAAAPPRDPALVDDEHPPARRVDERTVRVGTLARLEFEPDIGRWAIVSAADGAVKARFRDMTDALRHARSLIAAGTFDSAADDQPEPHATAKAWGQSRPRVIPFRSHR